MKSIKYIRNRVFQVQSTVLEKKKRKIKDKQWKDAIRLQKKIVRRNASIDNLIQLSMLNQLNGNESKAVKIFERALKKYPDEMKNDKQGFRKLVIFDNGETRIEFYKKLQKTKGIIVTFDSINMEWHENPFAFKLLSRQELDILAIRKRKKQTYQQDLTQEDFLKAVSPVVMGYKDRMAYGFSLGAYNALHFASLLDCRILAISPRLSIHPVYGRTKVIPKYEMKQSLSHPFNDRIAPVIVFDPKNALDNRYVNEEIVQSFPNAELVKIPYGGHGLAPHLLKMGQLKEFVVNFIEGNVPRYDRKLKTKSSIYFRNLGDACLKHNKLKWAHDLAEKSLELSPSDKNGIKLKVKVLKRAVRYEEAVEFIQDSMQYVSKILDIRLYLIDIYILMEEFTKAELEINRAIEQFGKRKSILKRLQTLSAAREGER